MDSSTNIQLNTNDVISGKYDISESQLVSIAEITQAITRRLDARETLPLLVEKARYLTKSQSTALVILDTTRSYLDFTAVAGLNAVEMVGQRISVDDALLGHTALSGEEYIACYPRVGSLSAEISTLDIGVRSVAVVPIYNSGKSVGALAAINKETSDTFSGFDILFLKLLANIAALAFDQDHLNRDYDRKQKERDILLEAAKATSSSLNVQDVLDNVLKTVQSSIEITSGAVYLLNDERNRLYIAADYGMSDDDRDKQLDGDSGWASQMLVYGRPVYISDTSSISPIEDNPLPGMRSLLVAPIIIRNSTEGFIIAGSHRLDAYKSYELELLSAVAGFTAISLENAWLYEDATLRAQEATAIYELSQSVGATLDLNDVLEFVADSVVSLLQVDKCALFLYNERSARLEIKAARNISEETIKTMQPGIGEGIAGWVIEFETPTAVQDVAADHRNRTMPIDIEDVKSLVTVPLQVGDKVIGVLHAMSSRRRLFNVGEMELLYTIGNQVAAAIVNAKMYEEANQKNEELRKSVRKISRALGTSTNIATATQIICDMAMEMVKADRCIVSITDGQGVIPKAVSNFKSAQGFLGIPVPATSPATWVARRRRSLMIEDIANETRFTWPEYVTRDRMPSYLGVPLKIGKETIGIIEVFTRERRIFLADEVRTLLVFASQASVGLKNAFLVEKASMRLNERDTYNNLCKLISMDLPQTDLCQQSLDLLAKATGSSYGIFRLINKKGADVVYNPDETNTFIPKCTVSITDLIDSALKNASVSTFSSQIDNELHQSYNVIAYPIIDPVDKTCTAVIGLARILSNQKYDKNDIRFLEIATNLISVRLR